MSKPIPPSTPEINRLRAATALIPIIESGLADSKLFVERAALVASFCEWATENVYRAAFQENQVGDTLIKEADDKAKASRRSKDCRLAAASRVGLGHLINAARRFPE